MGGPDIALVEVSPARVAARRLRPLLPTGIVIVLCAALGASAGSTALLQAALAVAAAIALGVGCVRSPSYAAVAVVVWLAVLATIRRILLGAGAAGDRDVLLLVAPAAVVLLVAVAARRGAFQALTPLARGVVILTALVALSALNPLQGGLTVGLAGLLFVLVPLLWFWVGRAVVDDRALKLVLLIVAGLGIGEALYGLYQVYRGFPAWDALWIMRKNYASLRVTNDAYRQFASFSSTSEYVGFLAIAVLVWAVRFRRGRTLVTAAALAVLTWAVLLASARGVLVLLPVGLGIIFAARRGYGLLKAVLMGLASLALLGAVISQIDADRVGDDRTSKLLQRQIEGITNPFDAEVSTLPIHLQQFGAGVANAWEQPVGQGVGSTTIAAQKFGGNTFGTETDPSNVAVAMGIPGLATYCFVAAAGLVLAYRTARRRRDFLSLVALGILVITSLQWLNGGNYAIAPFPWLALGWLDRLSLRRSTAPAPESSASA